MTEAAATPPTVIVTPIAPPAVKPAYKSTETYLNLATGFLGLLVSTGIIGSGSQINQIGGALILFASAAIHTWSRTSIKNAAVAP